METTTNPEATMSAVTYIFDREPELGTEPTSILHAADGRIYVTTLDGDIECGVEPVGILTYPCGCDATESCSECV